MAKTKKRKPAPSKKLKFKATLNRVFLGLVVVLLFSVAGVLAGLDFGLAASTNKTYTVPNGSYQLCLKYRPTKMSSWSAQMNVNTERSKRSIMASGSNSSTTTSQTRCLNKYMNVTGGKITVNYVTKNVAIDGQCRLNGNKADDRCR